MKWETDQYDDGTGGPWVVAKTPVGDFEVCSTHTGNRFVAIWVPAFAPSTHVEIGRYVSEAGGKRAVKRYAKRMAKAFQALARAGWE